ncbi:hypothetical protein SRIMM317S_05741 [Streptomyces rimosus subsp. rimosus]
MGRKERPLDPDAGPVERFAVDLRELRRKAGPLTYRDMARRVPYSVATLSRAASGEQLPSLAVTRAYVEACGGDVEEWSARWHRLAEETFVRTAQGDTTAPTRDWPATSPATGRSSSGATASPRTCCA